MLTQKIDKVPFKTNLEIMFSNVSKPIFIEAINIYRMKQKKGLELRFHFKLQLSAWKQDTKSLGLKTDLDNK